MTDPPGHPPKKRRPSVFIRIIIFLMGFLIVVYFSVFFGFNYFGEKLLRKYLKERVAKLSEGLYDVDFGKLTLNILTGKATIEEFEMSPDTVLYNKMKAKGTIRKSLYRIYFKALSVNPLNFLQIYSSRRINLKQIVLQEPIISIIGFPDTVTAKKSRLRIIYEDIYPTISELFNDFHVDRITINNGLLLTSFRQKTGRLSLGEYEFSSVLYDVSVNPFSYYNHERVFYSRDIEWIIHNLEISLGDSLYFLKAAELGFSLSKSKLWGKQLSLIPNFHSSRLKSVTSGDFFQIEIPDFYIDGIDLYKTLVDKKVEVKNVLLTDIRFKMFQNIQSIRNILVTRGKPKLQVANIYTIIAGALKSVAIDSFSLKDASFEYFRDLHDPNPELRITSVNLDLSNFFLNSLAYLNTNKIFYSDDIELQLQKVSMKLRDEVHYVNSEEIRVSTKKSLIDIHNSILFPDKKLNLQSKKGPINMISCLLPNLVFYDVDLKQVFNKRIINFDHLEIMEPDLIYTKYHKSKNPDPRFKSPESFFQEENEDVVYDLLKKYIKEIKGNFIHISRGQMQFLQEYEKTEKKIASGSFDLIMQDFLMDSIHGMNREGYFYSRDFTLDVNTLSYELPDSSRRLGIEQLHMNTKDSLIEIHKCSFNKISNPLYTKSNLTKKPNIAYDFTFNNLRVSGLNHKKLFLEKVLKANTIILEKPGLWLETEEKSFPEKLSDETILSQTSMFPRSFEIGKLLVKGGALSYNGQEEQKATYFSLKDIDFGIINAVVHIPEKGKANGLIKFDSLELTAFPITIILADSTYALKCNRLRVHSYPSDIIAEGIKIVPVRPSEEIEKQHGLMTIVLPSLAIKGFYFDKAIFTRQWFMDEIIIEEPSIVMERRLTEKHAPELKNLFPGQKIKFPLFMESVDVGKIMIKNGSFDLKMTAKDTEKSYSLSNINIAADRARIDSVALGNPETALPFFCQDITFSSGGNKWIAKDSMYTYSFTGFGFSTKARQAYLDSFAMTPNFSKFDFSRKIGHQIDRFVVKAPRVKLEYLDFQKLIHNQEIYARRMTIDGMIFESYRDKRVEFPKSQRPPLLPQMVKAIKIPMTIDTVILANGRVVYEEQTGEEPGRLFFDRMNSTLLNLTTDPVHQGQPMIIHGTSYLMGKSFAEASFYIPMNAPNDTFSIIAHIDKINLPDINPVLSKLLPFKIRSGTVTSTEVKQLYANNDFSKGIMQMNYQNISIELQNTKPGIWNKWETGLKTLLVNWLIPESNPKEDGKTRIGYIFYERDKSRGFFNFVWKSALSGIKSSLGVNSKEQKEIKKSNRKILK